MPGEKTQGREIVFVRGIVRRGLEQQGHFVAQDQLGFRGFILRAHHVDQQDEIVGGKGGAGVFILLDRGERLATNGFGIGEFVFAGEKIDQQDYAAVTVGRNGLIVQHGGVLEHDKIAEDRLGLGELCLADKEVAEVAVDAGDAEGRTAGSFAVDGDALAEHGFSLGEFVFDDEGCAEEAVGADKFRGIAAEEIDAHGERFAEEFLGFGEAVEA